MIELLNMDCMDYMAGLPDKAFDLAIVDPPYGVGDWQTVGDADQFNLRAQKKYGKVDWNDFTPEPNYFQELLRVSKEQIIWGANYYNSFPITGGAIVWDKKNDANRYSDGDIASCSLQKKISFFRFKWNGFLQEDMANKEIRIHNCQKPVQLYKWLLKNYAQPGDRILDTHLGSGSSAVAAHQMGFDFVGTEIDLDYYNAAQKRFKEAIKQQSLFAT
jgi:site-specific DNA-methyltransferase (adenine-specific)